MNKEIISGNDAQDLIKNVVIKLCDYVGLTLGPKGYNAVIDTDYSEPFITNDGVTIAKNLEFSPKEEVIAKIIKETSIKTCDKVGDGTTTSLVLLKSMYLECLNYINKGISPYKLKEELSIEIDDICNKLLSISRKALSKDIKNIGAISSGSEYYGKLISDIFKTNKNGGKIVIEESNNEKTYVEYIKGLFINSSVVSSYMIKDRLESEIIDNPYFLVTDQKIEYSSQISNIIDELLGKNLVIISDSFSEEVIEYLCSLKTNNVLNVIGIDAPNYSENKIDILEDICTYTSSKLLSLKNGKSIENASIEDLGKSKSIKVFKNNCIIENDENDNVKKRIDYIKKLIDKENDEYNKDILETRLSSLSSLTSIIFVGAKTKSEMILNKMRIEDAVYASKIAKKFGYSLGGGKEFYNISCDLNSDTIANKILKCVLASPIRKIIENSGDDFDNIKKTLESKSVCYGYDAYNNKVVDLIEHGIIDSTYVLIEALKNAFSISSILLTTSLIIVNSNKKEEKNITEVL